jgi:hypothetical protein
MAKILIDYIREHGLQKLESEFAIKIKRGKTHENLVLLKYNQLNSPMANPIVQECRGIILDEDDNWRVVSYAYRKFFNHGEGHAADIDWETARVYEKLDGSLMTMYWYDGWHVASSGVPDASGELMGTTTTFRELFFKVWIELGYTTKHMDKNVCYVFELMTPYNRVVVRHPKSRIVLHGARRLSDFKELNPVVEAHHNGWECVKILPLQSWGEIIEAAKTLEPMESEGYVVCDANYNRVKVKSPSYVAVAHMKDGFTTRRMLEIVRTNENSEFLSYYPEYTGLYYEIKAKYERMLGRIEGFYDGIKHIDDRKQFALLATTQKFSGTLFNLKFGQIDDAKQSLADMNIRQLEQWLGMKSVEL